MISGGTPGSLILDQNLEGIWRGTCPTSTSCLFAANNSAGASSLVSIDAAGSPSTPQTVPGAGQGPAEVVCPLSSSACGFRSNGVSGGMPTSYIAPVSNGVPGASVAVQGGFALLSITCPTTTTCLAGAYKGQGPSAVGGVATLSSPTTNVTVPSNNATVSGSQVLDAGASDAIGVTQVQYEITGGSLSHAVIATGSASIYGWLANWNTTTVANGTYTLQSVATDAVGLVTASAPITITVNNTPPPTTGIVIPSNNATVTGTQAPRCDCLLWRHPGQVRDHRRRILRCRCRDRQRHLLRLAGELEHDHRGQRDVHAPERRHRRRRGERDEPGCHRDRPQLGITRPPAEAGPMLPTGRLTVIYLVGSDVPATIGWADLACFIVDVRSNVRRAPSGHRAKSIHVHYARTIKPAW